jgi:hypothetical protein
LNDYDLTQPVWFVARIANKNMGYFEAVPIGADPVSGFIDYRITIDEEVFVVGHNPDKPIWSLLYRALEASLYGADDTDEEFPDL